MQQIGAAIKLYAAALWHWRWTVLQIAWLVCLLGWLAVTLLPDRYTVTARLVVDTETILSPLMGDMVVTPDFDRQVEMMRDTLLSAPNLDHLIETTGLERAVEPPLSRFELIERLRKQIDLSVEAKNLFEISYSHRDPALAHGVVATMLDIFVQQNLGHSQRDVAAAEEFIDQQIVTYDEKLRAAELKVASFQREHADELGGAERNVRDLERAEGEVRRLSAELESAYWRRDQIKVRLDATPKLVGAGQSTGGAPSPAQKAYDELSQELTRKLLVYTDRHPDILALRQLLAQAEVQLKQAQQGGGPSPAAGLRNPLYEQLESQLQISEVSVDDLSRRLQVAQGEVAELGKKVKQAPQVEADLKRLSRDYDVLLAQYEQLTKRRASAQLAADMDAGRKRVEFRVVDPPVRPKAPSGPPHGLLLIGVLLLGLGGGGAAAIARLLLSRTLLTVDQARHALQLPILGSVGQARLRGTARWDRPALAAGSVALVAAFGALFYLYVLSPTKPNLPALAASLLQQLPSSEANAHP